MIRKNVINYKLNLQNHATKSLYEEFLKSFHPEGERCPSCGALGQCRLYASYDRNIVDLIDGKPVSNLLHICRVLCTCGHSHAILPDFIVPYRQYSLLFILYILQVCFTHSMTLEEILIRFGVSHQLLKRWKEAFGKHKDLWLGIVRSRLVSFRGFLEQLLSLDPFSGFTNGFYRKTLYSFLQSHGNPANCRRHPPGFLFPGPACT